MSDKRMRVFAGPNGSGKSALFLDLTKAGKFEPKIFLNADQLEKELKERGIIELSSFGLQVDKLSFDTFLTSSSLMKKAIVDGFPINVHFEDNYIVNRTKQSHSYEASLVAAFIRQELLKAGISFAFETVMSHESKLEEIREANAAGYKTYLYFITTESPLINVERVATRVLKGGHSVEKDKIIDRYTRSLMLLYRAVQLVHRAYLFDNSGKEYKLVAQFYKGAMAHDRSRLPHWFHTYYIQRIPF